MTKIVLPAKTPEHLATETALHVAERTGEIPIKGNAQPIRFKVSETGCWIADGCRNSYGYVNKKAFRKTGFAHRLSFIHFCGETHGLFVLHKCDTPACCNPMHLYLGAHVDNMADMKARGRRLNKCVKLSESDIIAAKRLRNQGKSYSEIAGVVGCSQTQAMRVVNGKSRQGTAQDVDVISLNLSIKVGGDQIERAIRLARSGMAYVSVAKETGVTAAYISKIMRGKSKRGFEHGL